MLAASLYLETVLLHVASVYEDLIKYSNAEKLSSF